jgi:hypothetical protein
MHTPIGDKLFRIYMLERQNKGRRIQGYATCEDKHALLLKIAKLGPHSAPSFRDYGISADCRPASPIPRIAISFLKELLELTPKFRQDVEIWRR